MADIEKALTGKALVDYEPFVELIAAAMCSGIAYIGDGVKSGEVNPHAPLEPQAQRYAREFIKWRGAFMIDELTPAPADSENRS